MNTIALRAALTLRICSLRTATIGGIGAIILCVGSTSVCDHREYCGSTSGCAWLPHLLS